MSVQTNNHPRNAKILIGHQDVYNSLLNLHKKQRLPQTILLHGNKGIGKATLAYKLVKEILSNDSEYKQKYSNNAEQTIEAKVSTNQMLDVLVLEPKFDEKTKKQANDIKIDDVREIREILHSAPTEASIRFVIIDSVDELNINASNALLKLLEEPPHSTYFILISHSYEYLLDTIKSRAIIFNLKALSDLEFKDAIKFNSAFNITTEDDIKLLQIFAKNSLGKALILQEIKYLDLLRSVLLIIEDGNININKLQNFLDTFIEGKLAVNLQMFYYILAIFFNHLIIGENSIKIIAKSLQIDDSKFSNLINSLTANNDYIISLASSFAKLSLSKDILNIERRSNVINAIEEITNAKNAVSTN